MTLKNRGILGGRAGSVAGTEKGKSKLAVMLRVCYKASNQDDLVRNFV